MELGSMAEKFRESTGRREETTEREAHPGPGGFKERLLGWGVYFIISVFPLMCIC